MFKITSLLKKAAQVVLLIGVGLASLPVASASAAGMFDKTTPSSGEIVSNERLEKLWARLQGAYARQGERLGKAEEFIAKVQTLIDKANAQGYDTSAVQSALDDFTVSIPDAQVAHAAGAAIIASHAGFDENGSVTDRATALETTKSLGLVVKNTRSAMGGSGKALRDAICSFREAHRPISAEIPPTP